MTYFMDLPIFFQLAMFRTAKDITMLLFSVPNSHVLDRVGARPHKFVDLH